MSLPAEYNKANIDDVNDIGEEFRVLQACVSGAANNEDIDKDVRFGIDIELRRFDKLFSEFTDKVMNLIRCSKT